MPRHAEVEAFAEKLRLALGRANLSRTALAQHVGVDKSVVARWSSGALHPTDHSLAMLSAALGRVIPGFDRTTWDLLLPGFAARLGVSMRPASQVDPVSRAMLAPRLHGADPGEAETAYAGLWACFFSSVRGLGRLLCFVARIEAVTDAQAQTLRIDVSDIDTVCWRGTLVAYGARLYHACQDSRRDDMLCFTVLTGVERGHAAILEGLAVVRDGGPEGAPAATPVLYFRLGDSVDDAVFNAAGRLAAARNRDEGWEGVLPAPALVRFQVAMASAPAPTLLRRPISDCWATREEDLGLPTMAERQASLDVVRRLFAPVMAKEAYRPSAVEQGEPLQ